MNPHGVGRGLLRGVVSAMSAGIVLVALATAPARADSYSPAPVTGIGAVSGNGSLTISWTAPAYAGSSGSTQLRITEYVVGLTRAGVTGTVASCRTTTATACTFTGLTNGVEYWVEIKAYNSFYVFSYASAGPWKPCCAVPTAPTSMGVTEHDGGVTVSWGPPANSAQAVGPFTYRVASNPAGINCTTTALSCDISGLVNGTVFTVTVTASTSSGTSPAASVSPVIPKGPPGAPIDVRAILQRGSADVSWVGPQSTGGAVVSRYVVTSNPGGLTCETPGGLACTVSGLTNGTTYTFTVTAFNVIGPGPASAASPPAQLLAGPGIVRNIRVSVSRNRATVRWQQPASTGGLRIQQYNVVSSPGQHACTTRKTMCVISGLADGTEYVFTVVARNAKGPGVPASSRPVRTPAAPLPPPPAPEPEPEKPQQPLG